MRLRHKWSLSSSPLLGCPVPSITSLLPARGQNSPASSLSFQQCECWVTYAWYMPFLLLRFLQFITCWGVSKPCSYTYWMGEIVASTLRGMFRGRIITDTTKWRQQKVLPMFFVTWKPNKAVRFISEYFEVLKEIDRCCFSVVPAKPC